LRHWQSDWTRLNAWSPLLVSFLPIFLPLLAAAAMSLRVVTDASRRAERYGIMFDRLDWMASWFQSLRTPSTIRRAVARTEEILLDELVEWYAAAKDAGY
jgi:hypothetical protein